LISQKVQIRRLELQGLQKEAGSAPGCRGLKIDAEIEQLEAQIEAQERADKKGPRFWR
jgi:hypothetical protein